MTSLFVNHSGLENDGNGESIFISDHFLACSVTLMLGKKCEDMKLRLNVALFTIEIIFLGYGSIASRN